jgi:alkylation response protein AidB-like acyl-CoA dehydrogenase
MHVARPVGSGSLIHLFDERHREYREALRSVTEPWLDEVPAWEADGHLPRKVFRELASVGCFRERWQHGRVGGLPHALVAAEEMALVSGGLGVAVTLHDEVFIGLLKRLARTAWQRSILEQALDGVAIGCFASTERRGGSDISGAQVVATRDGDGWRLTGEKCYTSNAGRATYAVVLCRADGLPPGSDLCMFLVPLEADGIDVIGFYPKAGINSCDAAHIVMDAALPSDALLGSAGAGLLYANMALQLERISVAAQTITAARAALGLAVAHARVRQVADGPLMKMQAIRHRLADVATEVASAEALLHVVVTGAMAGRNVATETAALKLLCPRVAAHAVDESLQVLGARGYTSNYPLERYWRDVRVARMGAGTDEVMREIVSSSLDRPSPYYDGWLEALASSDLPVPDPVRSSDPFVRETVADGDLPISVTVASVVR